MTRVRRAAAGEGPHQESEIEAANVHEQALQDVRVPSQMRASHPTGFVEMRIWALQSLASAPLQPPSARATNPSTIGIDGVAGGGLLLPVPPSAIGLGDVGP